MNHRLKVYSEEDSSEASGCRGSHGSNDENLTLGLTQAEIYRKGTQFSVQQCASWSRDFQPSASAPSDAPSIQNPSPKMLRFKKIG